MSEYLITILTISYGIVWIVATIGYIPTIKELYFEKKLNVNVKTYMIWSFTSFIMFMYWIFVLKDPLFIIISWFWHIFCLTIFLLGYQLENTNKKRIKIKNKDY